MPFEGPLDFATQRKVALCDELLHHPERLQQLERTGLMGTPAEKSFDRLARLAAQILRAPLTVVSLVSSEKQFFKAGVGLPPPYDVSRELDLDNSICRFTLDGSAIIANDSSIDPLLKFHPAIKTFRIGAFMALPLLTEGGHVLGAFCAIDHARRAWSTSEIDVMRELTASVMTEIKLRLQLAELREQRESRERLVAAITHDLRSPITAAMMGAQMLQRKAAGAPELQKIANRIVGGMARTERMINDLLDASLVEAGQDVHISPSACDVSALIRSTLEALQAMHGSRLLLEAHLMASECIVECDGSAVQRILENLVNNAVKYGAPGAPISVRLSAGDGDIILEVHNSGNPISKHEQQAVFEPFTRTASASASGKVGWGIGLCLVKSLAEAHHGCVRVRSSAEDGTTFTVELPMHYDDERAAERRARLTDADAVSASP